ncbi:CUB and sushi domain-containing protein 1-like [Mercenaria mercenaria]|uniref:CUB and sushi domain-containing protein 1-like n=1 Tax=Mercenaria mercenaria TaxID=6596 RepID=UPI00234F49EC|nr:CUB and sushi domain-containing protein 1-like [Mercenaria mercenaria]
MYKEVTLDCWVYTSCLDTCAIENGQGSNVLVNKRQCEPQGLMRKSIVEFYCIGTPYEEGCSSNIAFNKSTSMSTLWTDWGEPYIYRSPLGVDGDTTQDKYAATCFVTDYEVGPWWRVDLGLCDRAHDLVLSVGVTESGLFVQYYLPFLFSTYPFTFISSTVAKFVQLEINATFAEHFHLCEVEVYGVPECGSLPNPSNGSVFTIDTTLDNYAEYTCNTGFVLLGNSDRKCQLDGTWTGSDPTCEPVDCGLLTSPENGIVTVSGLTYLNIATYSCLTGFTLTGSATRICMSDGNWNSSAPSCNPVDCGFLSNPENGTVSMSSSTYMSTATYSCLTGFSVTGSVTRICMSDGNWNSSAPSCNFVDCGSLPNPENGTVSMSGSTYMSTATYSCFTGFSLIGSVTRICMSDGNWNSSAPSCNLVDCGSLSNPENGTVSMSGSTYMGTAMYSCLTGFTLNGSSAMICMSDGNWNSTAPSCNPVDCGSLSSPANGTVSMSGSTYMSTATYICFTGFSLTGSVTRICMSDGNWNSSDPSCLTLTSVSTNTSASLSTPNALISGTFTTTLSSATTMPNPPRIYIMPCICYPNKTFTGLTREEIILKLITETEIDHKATTLSKSKLICREDSRKSSKIMGAVGASVLSTVFGLIFCSDLVTLLIKLKSVCTLNKVAANV